MTTILQIYRDFVKPGSEPAYRALEEEASRICATLGCPHPHFAIESLTSPTEVWWLNAYTSDADLARVANAYGSNRALMTALEDITTRKHNLTGTPEDLFTHYRPDSSAGPVWNPTGARFIVVSGPEIKRPAGATVFEAPDGRQFILTPVKSRAEADALTAGAKDATRVFAVRPYWGMPASEWMEADPEFWAVNPVSGIRT